MSEDTAITIVVTYVCVGVLMYGWLRARAAGMIEPLVVALIWLPYLFAWLLVRRLFPPHPPIKTNESQP